MSDAKRLLRVYVFGPISADNASDVLFNLGKGCRAGVQLFLAGTSPFVPHWNYHVSFEHKFSNDYYYAADNAWLEVSDALVGCKGWKKSKGSRAEVKLAKSLGIPVFNDVTAFLAAYRSGKVRARNLVDREG